MRLSPVILLFYTLLFIFSCSPGEQKENNNKERVFYCNVDEIDQEQKLFSEASGKDIFFRNIKSQSDDVSVSGNFSSKLTDSNPFGLTIKIDSIKPDDYLRVSAWRKSNNDDGVLVADGGEGFYHASKLITEEKNGWQKLLLEYFIPPNFETESLKIYTWNNGSDTVYFDDLKILHSSDKEYPEFDETTALHLYIDERDMQKIHQKRLGAFDKGVLVSSDDDYSNVLLFNDDDFLNGELRLKGDLVDHLQGNKWSFRIKLKKDFAWNNLRTFSIQNPSTRHFLHEWAAHKIFEKEDVLTTSYGFIPVNVNGESRGIYAWEEHFEKQLVESRNRREGPIVRFDESLFWQRVAETNKTGHNWDIDYFGAAQIIPFKEGKTTGDMMLSQQFFEAQKLLHQYKKRSRPVSEIYDIDKLAKYYALIDLTQAYHGFVWHNLRFYFNPVTCLLEPVAFDGYIEGGIYKRIEEPVLALLDPQKINTMPEEELMLFQVFSDSTFNNEYIKMLEKYSSNKFIQSVISNQKTEADSLKKIIQKEFPYYDFDFGYLQMQAETIKTNLEKIKSNIELLKKKLAEIKPLKFQKEYTSETNANLMPFLVQVYFDEELNQLDILNFHNSTVKIIGAFTKNELPEYFETTPKVAAYDGVSAQKISLKVNDKPTKILFSANDEIFETKITPWKYADMETSRQLSTSENKENYLREAQIIFDGDYTFSTDVIIQENKKVVVMPGTTINLVNGAGFFSWSALQINGTKENPVKIFSSDKSAQGFNVLQTKNRSEVSYAEFNGLSSIHRGGWQSPAAVNFYEADVDFRNCTFSSNVNCDDALNVVRSDFNVTECLFENTFADAFDSDFCTGKVNNCTFKNTGNDAIDFSGSQVTISSCKMIEISDKAISGGENSQLLVSNCEITKANIGVAAKDLSTLKLKSIDLNQTVYGLVAFQKKPEFGPAEIIIDNIKMKKYIDFHKIEEGSVLRLNGKTIHGREKKLALKLYL